MRRWVPSGALGLLPLLLLPLQLQHVAGAVGSTVVAQHHARGRNFLRKKVSLEAHDDRPSLDDDELLQLPEPAAALARHLREQRWNGTAASFLQLSAHQQSKQPYGDITSTLQMLNTLLAETTNKTGEESLRCQISDARLRVLIDQSSQASAVFTAMATAARAGILAAQGIKSMLSEKLPMLRDDLQNARASCRRQGDSFDHQMTIVQADIEGLQLVVQMQDCQLGLLQNKSQRAASPVRNAQEVRAVAAKLHSPTAKQMLLKLADKGGFSPFGFGFGMPELPPMPEPMLAPPARDRSERPLEARSGSITETMPGHIMPFPSCSLVFGRFLGVLGSLDDKLLDLRSQRDRLLKQCEEQHKTLEETIENHVERLSSAQAQLAKATKEWTDADEELRVEDQTREDLLHEQQEERGTCRQNLEGLEKQACGLRKVRGEMEKVQGGSVSFYQDCEVSEWTALACSAPCGGGTQRLVRRVTVQPNNGASCPALEKVEPCNQFPCPVDCRLDQWSGWSSCSVMCGGGVSARSRHVLQQMLNGGEPCGDVSETDTCNLDSCDEDCELSAWSPWSGCSKPCGGGHLTSTKTVVAPPRGDGKCPGEFAPERLRTQQCNEQACTVAAGQTTVQCAAKMDLVLLIDGSGEMLSTGWEKMRTAASRIVTAMQGGADNVQATAIVFSGPGNWANFQTCWSKSEGPDLEAQCGVRRLGDGFTTDTAGLSSTITQQGFPGGSSFTSLAVSAAEGVLVHSRPGVPSVVVLLTDGMPFSLYYMDTAVSSLHQRARLVVVPIGEDVSRWDMEFWASWPKEENLVHISNFESLESNDAISRVVSAICP